MTSVHLLHAGYAGDRVAAVAAATPEACDEALALIDVTYEELPAVFDQLQAMETDAPLVHDNPRAYEGKPGGPATTFAHDLRNGCTRMAWGKGDIDKGFADADVVLEHRFFVPSRHQAYLEPYASLIDRTGRPRRGVVLQQVAVPARSSLVGRLAEDDDIRVNVVNVAVTSEARATLATCLSHYFPSARAVGESS